MSDVCDRADGVQALIDRGASFAGPATSSSARHNCSCGGRPRFLPHPPLRTGGKQLETLACPVCGNGVGPFAARQALEQAWRMGGWNGGSSKVREF